MILISVRAAILVAAGALQATSIARAQDDPARSCVRLDDLVDSTAPGMLSSAWSIRAVSGQTAPRATVADLNGVPALVLEADSASGQVWRSLDRSIPPGLGRLEWAWRVDRAPPGTVLEEPDLDDAPARVFVVFGGGGLFGRPRTVFYTWGRGEEKGHTFFSHVGDRVVVIILRNAEDPLGMWVEERRDVFGDFRRAYNREPDEIRAVGLMADTEETGGHSLAYLKELRWNPQVDGTSMCRSDGGTRTEAFYN